MTGYLLDTNVLSEVLKKRPSEQVRARIATLPRDDTYTSSICVMELRFGAARHRDGKALWERIRAELLSQVTVLSVGEPEATLAGEILAALERRGQPIGTEDVIIGATALVHGLTVATRNVAHLARIDGLAVENWW